MYVFLKKYPNFFAPAHLLARHIFYGKTEANQTINWLRPKRVFRRFAFIQANIFFLKIKKDFNKNRYFMSQILTSNVRLTRPLASI